MHTYSIEVAKDNRSTLNVALKTTAALENCKNVIEWLDNVTACPRRSLFELLKLWGCKIGNSMNRRYYNGTNYDTLPKPVYDAALSF